MEPIKFSNLTPFRKRLTGPPILCDGGMGTELYTRGVYVNVCFDELNAIQPDLVAAVHADYLRAGSEIIETNTYGANRFKLAPHGLENAVFDLNRRGAIIARQAMEKSGRDAYIAGSIGPLGRRLAPLGTIEPRQARETFINQARGLTDGGVDLIMIETMIDPTELTISAEAVREVTDMPLIAQFTLTDWNETAYGASLERIANILSALNVDAVGINCSLGPNKLLEAAQELMKHTDRPVVIQPNAGELEWVEGRLICKATPEYFAEYAKRLVLAGVKVVGGCCGSTPDHIRAMNAALRAVIPELSKVAVQVSTQVQVRPRDEKKKIDYASLSPMAKALAEKQFIFSVEINPPRSPVTEKIIEHIRDMKAHGVMLVNVPDSPRASARMSAMVLASVIQEKAGVDTILHYTCRDRNILGMQSDLLGAEVLGLDNILCVTGDPPKLGDYPMATAVFDVDAIGLLRIADNLNHSLDLAGNPIPKGTSFHLGCGANPGAINLEMELDRLHRKLENGARYVMTQPAFDEELLFKFLDKLNMPKVPILVGILPLASFRNAEFFHNEVPGMQVPQSIRDRLKPITDRDHAARIGVEIAAEALLRSAPRCAGAYVMPPFGRTELALQVIELFRHSDYGRQRLSAGEIS